MFNEPKPQAQLTDSGARGPSLCRMVDAHLPQGLLELLEGLPTARMLCVKLPWKPGQASQGLEKHRAGHSLISHVTPGPSGPSAVCGAGLG